MVTMVARRTSSILSKVLSRIEHWTTKSAGSGSKAEVSRGRTMSFGGGSLGLQEILDLLPHRAPALLVDHAEHNRLGEGLVSIIKQSMVPVGKLTKLDLLEAMGQTGALVIRQIPSYFSMRHIVFAGMHDVQWDYWQNDVNVPVRIQATFTRQLRNKFGEVYTECYDPSMRRISSGTLLFSFITEDPS